jgi:hypothetical protein
MKARSEAVLFTFYREEEEKIKAVKMINQTLT